LSALKIRNHARLLVAALFLCSGLGVGAMTASAQNTAVPGRILFVRDGNVWVWSNGDAKRVVEDGAGSDARWSPDGTHILYVRSENSYSDLILYNALSGASVPITYNRPDYEEGTPEYIQASAWAVNPDWSASGLIGYITDRDSEDGTSFELWLIDDPTAGPYRAPLNGSEDNIEALSLSSGGSLAAYTVQRRLDDGTSANRAVLRDLTDGSTYELASSKNAFDPAISPDSTSIAVSIRTDEMSDVFLVDRATGKITRVTRNMQSTKPTWSPDGKWVAFVRMVDYQFEVWAAPVVDGNPGRPFKIFKAKDLDALSGISWTYSVG
jgi:Tol biopolymer transport system component